MEIELRISAVRTNPCEIEIFVCCALVDLGGTMNVCTTSFEYRVWIFSGGVHPFTASGSQFPRPPKMLGSQGFGFEFDILVAYSGKLSVKKM